MPKLVALVETAADCRRVLAFQRASNKEVMVISLSLDALHHIEGTVHVWRLLDMEEVFVESYAESLALGERWGQWESARADGLYDQAARYQLSEECWYHALVCKRVAEKLSQIFLRESYVYLDMASVGVLVGTYSPKKHHARSQNILFSSIVRDVFRECSIPIQLSVRWGRVINFLSVLSASAQVLKKSFFDVGEYFYARLRGVKSLSSQFSRLHNPEDITHVVSGWGKDLSRFFRYNTFADQMAILGVKSLNLVYRPKKIIGFLEGKSASGVQDVVIREDIRDGVAAGARMSMLSLKGFFSRRTFTRRHIAKRYARLLQLGEDSSSIFSHEVVRLNSRHIIYFAYRASFVLGQMLEELIKHIPNASVFLGSDSAGAVERFEMLTMAEKGLATVSVPHSYRGYAMEPYTHLAEHVQVVGTANSAIVHPNKEQHVSVVGASHPRERGKDFSAEGPIHVVIGVRSRGGLWSSYSFKQDVYHRQLEELVDGLLEDERVNITIKSHPNGDYSDFYDHLVKSRSSQRLIHEPRGWKLEKFIVTTDLLICPGEMPSFYVSGILAGIPVVFIKSSMTSVTKAMSYQYDYAGIVAEDVQEALPKIQQLLSSNESYGKIVMSQEEQKTALDGGRHPERSCLEHIQEVLAQKN